MARDSLVLFAEGWFIQVEKREGSDWVPLEYLGRPFNDQQHVFHVRKAVGLLDWNPFVSDERWKATIFLPRAVSSYVARLVAASRPTAICRA